MSVTLISKIENYWFTFKLEGFTVKPKLGNLVNLGAASWVYGVWMGENASVLKTWKKKKRKKTNLLFELTRILPVSSLLLLAHVFGVEVKLSYLKFCSRKLVVLIYRLRKRIAYT